MRVLALVVTLLGAVLRPSSAQESTCPIRSRGVMIVADALGQVRGARVFADDTLLRSALGRLEVILVEAIEGEPDSTLRRAAWHYAGTFTPKDAQDRRARLERQTDGMRGRLTSGQYHQILQERLTREYRIHMENVVELVSPATSGGRYPTLSSWKERCASKAWQRLHAAALEAAAL